VGFQQLRTTSGSDLELAQCKVDQVVNGNVQSVRNPGSAPLIKGLLNPAPADNSGSYSFGTATAAVPGTYSMCWRGVEPFGRFHLTGPMPGGARPNKCTLGVTDCMVRLEGYRFSQTNQVRSGGA
jgi:hypothetical protein